jgi:hypothetical protein
MVEMLRMSAVFVRRWNMFASLHRLVQICFGFTLWYFLIFIGEIEPHLRMYFVSFDAE